MTAAKISEIIDDSALWIFGIRALHDDELPAVGDMMPASYVWEDGDRSEDCIGGTCAFLISELRDGWDIDGALKHALAYNVSKSKRYALLAGKYTGNNDLIEEPDTVSIRDAAVLAVWEAANAQA